MIELIQFPWSPFCIVQRRILEFSGAKFKIINVPNGDRSLVWRLTRERYYAVPIIRDAKTVIFEVSEDSQVIAKYIDTKFGLGLFPWDLEGVQSIINKTGRALAPRRASDRPHPHFLKWHREHCFKQ